MKRHFGRLVGMSLILAGTSIAPVAAAGELGLSLDGVHWANAISDPLFDPSMRWVPGDSENATFFIRNQGGSGGDLTVDVISSTAGDLIDSGDLHITAKGGGGAWKLVSRPGRHRLLTAPNIPDGQIGPVVIDVSFDGTSTNQTQVRSSDPLFKVTLTESNKVADVADSLLPDTGAPDLRLYAALSAILLGTGLAFAKRRSEPQREVDHV